MAKKKVYDVDLSDLVKRREGRAVLNSLIERFGYYGNTTNEFQQGMRAAAVEIVQDLERIAPDALVTMMRERLDMKQPRLPNDDEEPDYDD